MHFVHFINLFPNLAIPILKYNICIIISVEKSKICSFIVLIRLCCFTESNYVTRSRTSCSTAIKVNIVLILVLQVLRGLFYPFTSGLLFYLLCLYIRLLFLQLYDGTWKVFISFGAG